MLDLRLQEVGGWQGESDLPDRVGLTDVSIGPGDSVYLFVRESPMVTVYNSDGTFRDAWLTAQFGGRPHALTVHEDEVFCIEDFGSEVREFGLDGSFVMPIGPSGTESENGIDWSVGGTITRLKLIREEGGPPYNHPADLAVAPNGNRYVADGHGNCRIHCFSPDGQLLHSWGRSGSDPGEFRLPHAIAIEDDLVYVADRENDRIQVFELDGTYVQEWTDLHRPSSIAAGPDGTFVVGEVAVKAGRYSFTHGTAAVDLPGRLSFRDRDGQLLETVDPGDRPVQPHGIAVDSTGAVYVASSGTVRKFAAP